MSMSEGTAGTSVTQTQIQPIGQGGPVDGVNHDTYNTILGLDALMNASAAAPPLPTQPVHSSTGSSSLSELDEDENLESTARPEDHNRVQEDNDSEAETERLAGTPYKAREKPLIHRAESNLRHHESINDASDDDGLNIDLLSKPQPGLESRDSKLTGSRSSPDTLAGTKRKLGSLMGNDGHASTSLNKRPTLGGHMSLDNASTSVDDADADGDQGSVLSSGVSDVSERSYPATSDEEQATSGGDSGNAKTETDKTAQGDEDDTTLKAVAIVKGAEPEDLGTAGADREDEEEDAEASVKGEDEMARKLKAIADLAPIEKLFSMFRDKLHEERIAALDAELDLLNDPDCTQPDFLAQRLCIDARRDEKVHLEQIAARLNKDCQDRVMVAKRAQIHCQYFQEARSIREETMGQLNEMYCNIQTERRIVKLGEPHYVYTLDPKHSKRIAHQTAYNKEVSLLSGIARHIGFPAAPAIVGLPPAVAKADLEHMGLLPRSLHQ